MQAAGCSPRGSHATTKGLRVLLIDAGSDPRTYNHYQVPAFHALATEDPRLRWDYFVEHFSDPDLAVKDEKYAPGKGIFYPRAGAIGGCTAHHAMITVYPDPSDWDGIATMTVDDSWRSERMWEYFERCRVPKGFGWLGIEAAGIDTVLRAVKDKAVDAILLAAIHSSHRAERIPKRVFDELKDLFDAADEPMLDPNHFASVQGNREGLYRIPLSTKGGRRHGVTEFILRDQRSSRIWQKSHDLGGHTRHQSII